MPADGDDTSDLDLTPNGSPITLDLTLNTALATTIQDIDILSDDEITRQVVR